MSDAGHEVDGLGIVPQAWYDLNMTNETRLTIDEAIRVQVAHTRNWDGLPAGDDDHDYMSSAYQLVADLVQLRNELGVNAATIELHDRLTNPYRQECIAFAYACDGVAPEINNAIPEEVWES